MKKLILVLTLTLGTLISNAKTLPNEFLGRDGVWHVIYDNSKISNIAREAIKIQKQRLNYGMIDIYDYENYVRMFVKATTADEIAKLAIIIKK